MQLNPTQPTLPASPAPPSTVRQTTLAQPGRRRPHARAKASFLSARLSWLPALMLEHTCLREVVTSREGRISVVYRREGPPTCGVGGAARKRRAECAAASSRRRRRPSECSCSNQPSSWEGEERWDSVTTSLVGASTFPFVLLLLPQMARNAINMTAGNSSALSILSWMGYLTSLLGNAILLSYFVGKEEHGAAIIQAIGVASNFTMLAQIYLAGYLQASAFWTTAVFAASTCLINSTHIMDILDAKAWSLWENFLGIIGLGVLIQVLWTTLTPFSSQLPGCLVAAAALVATIMDHKGFLSRHMKGFWSSLSAWTATLLFGFQPIGQLTRNFMDPASLLGLSVGSVILAMTGNGLMVPRALKTRDRIWLTGTLWGSLMGWAQLLSMYLGGAATGVSYINHSLFICLTFLVGVFFWTVLAYDSYISRLPFPWSSLVRMYGNHKS